jgi:hypothetical protein
MALDGIQSFGTSPGNTLRVLYDPAGRSAVADSPWNDRDEVYRTVAKRLSAFVARALFNCRAAVAGITIGSERTARGRDFVDRKGGGAVSLARYSGMKLARFPARRLLSQRAVESM